MLPLIPFAALVLAAAPDHESQNPLFRELREKGVEVDEGRVPMPAPIMPDGLNAAAQVKILEQLAGQEYSVEELTRNSPVAPFILRINDLKPSDPKAPTRGVDLWFVVYGSLDMPLSDAFVERVLGDSRKNGKARDLKPEELAKRDIKLSDPKHEGYGYVEFNFLERVMIHATGRSYVSRTDDSVLAATQLDSRFENDPEYPNRWRVVKNGNSTEWHPYRGSGQYLKVTRMHEPKGALFVEHHMVFTEPVGWFDGANFLRSKLPQAAQIMVRSMRRELMKEQKK
jgi:hypothetical protein